MAAQRLRRDRSQPVANPLGADSGSDRSRQRCGLGRRDSGPSRSQNPCTHSDEVETGNAGTRTAPRTSAHAPRQQRLLARRHGPTPRTHCPTPNGPRQTHTLRRQTPAGDKAPLPRLLTRRNNAPGACRTAVEGAGTAPFRAQPETAPHFSANVWTVIALCSLLVLCCCDGLVLAWFGVVVIGWFGLRLLLWFLALSCICSDCICLLSGSACSSPLGTWLPALLRLPPGRRPRARPAGPKGPDGRQGRLRMPLSPSMPPMSGSSQAPTGWAAAADQLAVQRDSAAATSPPSGCDRLRPVGRARVWP